MNPFVLQPKLPGIRIYGTTVRPRMLLSNNRFDSPFVHRREEGYQAKEGGCLQAKGFHHRQLCLKGKAILYVQRLS